MRKGQAKSVVKRAEDLRAKRTKSIQLKCHPALFELAPLWKESISEFKRLGSTATEEQLADLKEKFEKRLEEIQAKYSDPRPPEPDTFAAQAIFRNAENMSDADGITDWIHFERHKVPLKRDLKKRQNKDWSSTRRVLRTASDIEQLRCEMPIRPFKGNLEHQNMFETMWGFGVERLNPDELAVFFDQFCPCGNEGHDPDGLKKHKARFARSIKPSE